MTGQAEAGSWSGTPGGEAARTVCEVHHIATLGRTAYSPRVNHTNALISPRRFLAASLALAAVMVSGTAAVAADPTAAPSPSISADATVSSRGTHCIECYLFWDPVADARAVLDVPITVAGPAWLALELASTDGTTVRLADHAGRPVLIELMATWCASCEEQQDALREARADLPADTVIVSLDVDPTGDLGALAAYAAERDYDWVFASASRELLRALVDAFGDDVINPAATPVLVIDRDGTAWLPPLGRKSAATLVDLLVGA